MNRRLLYICLIITALLAFAGIPALAQDPEAAPATEESAPVTEESAPVTEESAPATEESAPVTEESAPATEESAPATEEASPVAEFDPCTPPEGEEFPPDYILPEHCPKPEVAPAEEVMEAEATAEDSSLAPESGTPTPAETLTEAVEAETLYEVEALAEENAVEIVLTDGEASLELGALDEEAAEEVVSSEVSDPFFTVGGGVWFAYSSGACATAAQITATTGLPATTVHCNLQNTGGLPPVGSTTIPVQNAVNNAPAGSTVHVLAGVYQEQVVINQAVNLQGYGSPTLLSPPGTLPSNFGGNYAVVQVNNAIVNISGFIFNGNGNGNANFYFMGIGFNGGGGTISNNSFVGFRNTPFDGAQHGEAIYATNGGPVQNLNILNNSVSDFQKNGFTISGNYNVNISGNTIVGAGDTPIIAQNGIQVDTGVTGTISNNSISNIGYIGPTYYGAGILVFTSDGMQVTGNTLNNVQGGVLVVDSDNTNITGNTFNNNQAAVGLYCGNNNSIDGNIFQNNDAVLEVDSTGCDPMLGTNMNGNDMVDNGVIVNNTGTSVIDATNNYIDPKPKPSAIGTGAPFVLFDPQSPTPFFLSLNRQIPGGPAGPVVLLPCTNNPDFAVFIIDQNKDFDIYRINGNQGLGLKRYAGLELNDFQSRNQNRTPALLGSLLPQNINALFAGRNEDFKTFYIGNNQWRFELRVNGALVRSDICTRR